MSPGTALNSMTAPTSLRPSRCSPYLPSRCSNGVAATMSWRWKNGLMSRSRSEIPAQACASASRSAWATARCFLATASKCLDSSVCRMSFGRGSGSYRISKDAASVTCPKCNGYLAAAAAKAAAKPATA